MAQTAKNLIDSEKNIVDRIIDLRKLQTAIYTSDKFRYLENGVLEAKINKRLWQSIEHYTLLSLLKLLNSDQTKPKSPWHDTNVWEICNRLFCNLADTGNLFSIIGSRHVNKNFDRKIWYESFEGYLFAIDILLRAVPPEYPGRKKFSFNTIRDLIDDEAFATKAKGRRVADYNRTYKLCAPYLHHIMVQDSKLLRWRNCRSTSSTIKQIEMLENPDLVRSELVALSATVGILSRRLSKNAPILTCGEVDAYQFDPLSKENQESVDNYGTMSPEV
jgi:hypothetical protein